MSFEVIVQTLQVEVATQGTQGPQGPMGAVQDTFETIATNIKAYPHAITYEGDKVKTLVYTLPGPLTVTKTLNYTDGKLITIVLSGSVPSGVALTKTFAYSGDTLTSISYS